MVAFLPPYRIDPATLPPLLLTSEPGSFARRTMAERYPHIIEDVIDQNRFPEPVNQALAGLGQELLSGAIQPLREDAADRGFWDAVSAPYLGRSWLDVPWYWAETYAYRRMLEATRYFQPGPWSGFDLFAAGKRAEWQPGAAPAAVATLLSGLPSAPELRFKRLLTASLWGNRIDLSMKTIVARYAGGAGRAGQSAEDQANVLADDSQAVWDNLHTRHTSSGSGPTVILIADNTGTELSMDLALIDFLLAEGLAGRVELHCKGQPFFVSDTMPADVEVGLQALTTGDTLAANLADRIRSHLSAGRLLIRTHWFYTTSLFYFRMPDDLFRWLEASSLVILKGDANYRRLVGDAALGARCFLRGRYRVLPGSTGCAAGSEIGCGDRAPRWPGGAPAG